MTKTKLFIDFDDTLFDRGRFVPDMFSIIRKYGFDDEEIEGSYKIVYSDGYEGIWSHLAYLHENVRSFDLNAATKDIEKFLDAAKSYLFPGAVPFLEKVNRNIYDLRLLTVGGLEFQKLKVSKSGIEKYFDQCHYSIVNKAAALENLVGKDEIFVLLDDKEREIVAVRAAYPKSLAIQIEKGRLLECLNPLSL